jgi:hypothetical protein
VLGGDVPFEELARRRVPVDIPFVDLNPLLRQKTSGIATGGSGRLPIKEQLGHGWFLPATRGSEPVPRWRPVVQLDESRRALCDTHILLSPSRV